MPYFETSAKDNVNVDKGFEQVAKLAFGRQGNNNDMYFKYFYYLDLLKVLLI